MSILIIASTSIRQDADGRYCLNDLHRASGGEARNKPGNWLMLEQTKALAVEIEIAGIPAIQSKQGLGTYVCKELVYAYAMWISAAFHLKVIRAYDAVVAAPPTEYRIPKSLPEALRLAADESERADRAEIALSIAELKAQALDRLAHSVGEFGVREAAKDQKMTQKKFTEWLIEHRWAFRNGRKQRLLGYADKEHAGYVRHHVKMLKDEDGDEFASTRLFFTAKGMAKLATEIAASKEVCTRAPVPSDLFDSQTSP